MRLTAFTITVNGQPVDIAHAASSYDYASFDITGPVNIEITAAEPHFWDRGVDIQPWHLGLRATRDGQTIRFRLSSPAKLAISRPRDFLNHATMLFLFAGRPPAPPPNDPKVQVYKPGVYHHSLSPKSGDTLYLAPGSYFYGSLNLFNVENVKVLGRGTIIYDGPQDPTLLISEAAKNPIRRRGRGSTALSQQTAGSADPSSVRWLVSSVASAVRTSR